MSYARCSSTSKDAIDHVLDVQAQLLTSLRAAKEERLCRGDAETSHEEQVIAGALQRSLAHLVGQTSTRLSDLVSPPSIPSSSAHYSMLVCIAQAVQKRRTNTDHAAAAPASAADESSTAEAPMSSSEGTDKTALAQCTNCCVLDTPAWHQGLTADSLLCHGNMHTNAQSVYSMCLNRTLVLQHATTTLSAADQLVL